MTSFEEYCPFCGGGLLASGGLLAGGGYVCARADSVPQGTRARTRRVVGIIVCIACSVRGRAVSTVTDEIVRISIFAPARTARIKGAIVSIMILMPANAFSISLCTRSTSDLRNVCSCRSSDESLSSPSIEFEVKRTTEDMILSASTSIWVSGFEILFSTKLPLSASPSDESDFSAGAAEDDVGEFIGISSKRNLNSTRA